MLALINNEEEHIAQKQKICKYNDNNSFINIRVMNTRKERYVTTHVIFLAMFSHLSRGSATFLYPCSDRFQCKT